MMKTDKQIIEEFDEKFRHIGNIGVQCDNITVDNIKQFILTALKEQREALMLDEDEIQKIIFYGSRACVLNEHIFVGQEFSQKLAKAIIQHQKEKFDE